MSITLRRLGGSAALLACTLSPGCSADMGAPDVQPPSVRIAWPLPWELSYRERDSIRVEAHDNEGVVRVEVFLSGARVGTLRGDGTTETWDTHAQPDGEYTLTVRAYDLAGNTAADSVPVRLASLLLIRGIEVRDVTDLDALGRLEIEAHLLEDRGGGFLGCAGQQTGLEEVDEAGVRYTAEAYFVKPLDGRQPLTFAEVVGRSVYLRVAEDDTAPCPSPFGGDFFAADDHLGGTSLILEPGFTSRTLSFGNVAHLGLTRGRLP